MSALAFSGRDLRCGRWLRPGLAASADRAPIQRLHQVSAAARVAQGKMGLAETHEMIRVFGSVNDPQLRQQSRHGQANVLHNPGRGRVATRLQGRQVGGQRCIGTAIAGSRSLHVAQHLRRPRHLLPKLSGFVQGVLGRAGHAFEHGRATVHSLRTRPVPPKRPWREHDGRPFENARVLLDGSVYVVQTFRKTSAASRANSIASAGSVA